MLYVFHGSDRNTVADRTQRFVDALLTKRPGAQVFSFDETSIDLRELDALTDASGLFVEKHIILLKGVYAVPEHRASLLERLPSFAASTNIVVVREDKLLKEQQREFERVAHNIEEHTSGSSRKRSEFNVFALTDALSAKDRRLLWVGYVQARRAGLSPEHIAGTLHWGIKALLAAKRSATVQESGLKPGVYERCSRAAQHFSLNELTHASHSLVGLYHDAHRGLGDLDLALERWCVSFLTKG
jgi:DNA polymerase III delta subunit